MSSNPLSSYFRTEKMFIGLPSDGHFYKNGEVEFNDSGEVGILPMTGADEMLLKNPDALLNGEAIERLIKSCVPAVKNVKGLLINDLDAMIVAIRHASHGKNMDIYSSCPKCNGENKFSLDLDYVLSTVGKLDDVYPVNLDNGMTIFIRPLTYTDTLKTIKCQFEQSKIEKSMTNDMSPEARLKTFSESFKQIEKVNFELILSSILKVVDESRGINVVDKEHIKEFLMNTDSTTIKKIENAMKPLSSIGVKNTFTAKCSEPKDNAPRNVPRHELADDMICGHEWEEEVNFNPVNFSTGF